MGRFVKSEFAGAGKSGNRVAKSLIVGDMHCKQGMILPLVDAAAEGHGVSRIVFLGDYADEWNSTACDVVEGIDIQLEWANRISSRGVEVIFLLGNHDFEYLLGEGCSGTHLEAMADIKEALGRIDMRVAADVDGYLVTHAGLTQGWRSEYAPKCSDARDIAARLNELYLGGSYYDWRKLAACGPSRGGHEIPSPLWADKRDLEADAALGIRQIAGHTPVKTCGRLRRRDVDVWLCDTFSLTSKMCPIGDGSMLLIEDGDGLRISTNWMNRFSLS